MTWAKNSFHTILEQFRTKPTDHSKEGRVGKGKLGNSAHTSSGASAVERVRSAADDNQAQLEFMCSQVFKIHYFKTQRTKFRNSKYLACKPSLVQKTYTFSYPADAWESLQEMLAIHGLDVTV